jgi:tRNA threonylcarbamoyladenosine biosynthesis protein TsaB
MALILSIETATTNCSVAIHRDGQLLALKEQDQRNIHASALFVFIEEIMRQASLQFNQLDAVAVSKGPGSYTGLRIGVSAAKGFCYGLSIPLLSVNTLKAMAYNVLQKEIQFRENASFVPMLDARRMEVYCAVYDQDLNEVSPVSAVIIDEGSFSTALQSPVYFFGEGMEKSRPVLSQSTNAFFIEDISASAKNIGALAAEQYSKGQFEDTAYFEPYYLKEFVSQGTFHKK